MPITGSMTTRKSYDIKPEEPKKKPHCEALKHKFKKEPMNTASVQTSLDNANS